MYNIDKLEEQWKRYHRKKIMPHIFFTIFSLVTIVAVVYLTDEREYTSENNASVFTLKKKVSLPTSDPEKKVKIDRNSSVVKLNTLSTEVPSLSSNQNQAHPGVGQIVFQDSNIKSDNRAQKRKNLLIHITERDGKEIAIDIEKRFEFAKDKSDSLFLAKYYYDRGNYKKSEKWALETNKLDSAMGESWLVFAKSLARQGKRVESLKVLKAFFDISGSIKAKSLIDKIRRGKAFK